MVLFSVIGPLDLAAELLGQRELELAKILGNRKKVTAPNHSVSDVSR
jgi:hypothetical protein